jgi:DNA-directed RNA polymerase specialized sigma24 family protein
MSETEVKKGNLIADNIRKTLLSVDLRIIDAEAKHKLFYEDFKLHSKFGGASHTKKALRAKAKSEVYRIYIDNIGKIKGEITFALNTVLSRYTPKYKRIWEMYFLEQASIDEIATATNYAKRNVNKIVQKLKLDICSVYGEEGENNE